MRLLTAYHKLHLYAPRDLGYLLSCKLMLGRPEQDGADIAVLRQVLAIQNRAQAQQCCQTLLALLCCALGRSTLIRLR